MASFIKKMAFLTPKPGVDDATFRAYWRGVHGPLVAGSPDYGAWRLRYVQNHVVGPGPVGLPLLYGGMAEFWLPGRSPNEDAFSATETYRNRIRVDEENFIAMDRTVSMAAAEHVVKPGHAATKLVILSGRAPDLSPEAYRARFDGEYADAVLGAPSVRDRLRGWIVDHVIPGTFRLPGALYTAPLLIDSIEAMWFDSPADLWVAFAARNAASKLAGTLFDSPSRVSFQSEELVFFDLLACG